MWSGLLQLLHGGKAEAEYGDEHEETLHGDEATEWRVPSVPEVSRCLVDLAVFKTVGTSDPRPAGSIPVRLRHSHAGPGTRPRHTDIP